MNIGRFFRGRFLKASGLDHDLSLTIKTCSGEEFEDGQKPVLSFQEIEQGLVLNQTNARVLIEAYGYETDSWLGKPLTVFKTDVEYKGQRQPGLRVRIPTPAVEITSEDIPFSM